MYTGDFPMTGGAVLPRRGWKHRAPRAGGIPAPLDSFEGLNVPETEALESGKRQTTAGSRHVSESVATHITIVSGIGSLSDPDAVENDYDGAPQFERPM
jgi:hypothetical protein